MICPERPHPVGEVRASRRLEHEGIFCVSSAASERAPDAVNFNDRGEVLLKAMRWVPAHIVVDDAHNSLRVIVEVILESVGHYRRSSVDRIPVAKGTIHCVNNP